MKAEAMEWQPCEGFVNVAEPIETELRAILRHLGRDAPEPSTNLSPEVNQDGLIQFVTTADVFRLAGEFAVRFQPLPGGMEDVTFWQDGVHRAALRRGPA
ncbi:MAG TPA: hypothetical protein VFS38_04690 [Actinomycetota bacterium]|nr:hypothetical protein [Actinomycetota bacterium]